MLELALAILISATPDKPKEPETPAIPGVEQPQVDEPKAAQPTKTEPLKAEPAKPEAAKVEAKKDEKADAKPEPKKTEKTLPPAVTQSGLCAELNRNGLSVAAQRKKLEEERKDIATQREELEKISTDIAKSRAELRVETERLESLLGQAPGGTGPARAALNGTVGQGQLESLAKAIKGMKPDSAAALMQRTDPKLAAQLLQRMKPSDAGAVMDHLKPDLAADLLAQMATLPAPRKP